MTASGAPSSVLGDFDLRMLKAFRDLAETHVRKASTEAVTAAANPSDYIDQSFLDDFVDLATGAWDEALGVVAATFGDLPIPILSSTINSGIRESANYYDELLRALVGKNAFPQQPVYGEFLKGAVVQYGDVRPLLARLGGGSTEPSVQLAGGITSGTTMTEWLRSNGIDTDKKIWLYGYEDEPRRTFNGHLQMDGLVFDSWQDDALLIAPQDYWLRREHYVPGDHFGCACVVAPYFPNFGDDYVLELET